jgi:hypothetical protein
MQVHEIKVPAFEVIIPEHLLTEEQLMNELEYLMAEKRAKMMFSMCMINDVEYRWIMAENRLVFKPLLASIY